MLCSCLMVPGAVRPMGDCSRQSFVHSLAVSPSGLTEAIKTWLAYLIVRRRFPKVRALKKPREICKLRRGDRNMEGRTKVEWKEVEVGKEARG